MPSASFGDGLVRLVSGAIEFQNVRTWGLAAVRAAPRTDGRRRSMGLPAGALGRAGGGQAGGGVGGRRVGRDGGHLPAPGVVVPVGAKRGDVEQAGVEPVGTEQSDR